MRHRIERRTSQSNRARAASGLGVNPSSRFLRTDLVVMGILIIGAIAWLFDLAMRWVERRVVPWKGRG